MNDIVHLLIPNIGFIKIKDINMMVIYIIYLLDHLIVLIKMVKVIVDNKVPKVEQNQIYFVKNFAVPNVPLVLIVKI